MRFLITTILSALLTFTAARADDSGWPFFTQEASPKGTYSRGEVIKVPVRTYNVWVDDYVPFGSSAAATGPDKGGQSPTSQADLDILRRRHAAYWMRRNAELVSEDGLVPVLPVRIFTRWAPEFNAGGRHGTPVISGE